MFEFEVAPKNKSDQSIYISPTSAPSKKKNHLQAMGLLMNSGWTPPLSNSKISGYYLNQ